MDQGISKPIVQPSKHKNKSIRSVFARYIAGTAHWCRPFFLVYGLPRVSLRTYRVEWVFFFLHN